MSGHLDGPPPGPQDPPYIPGDLGAPSAEEFARRRASPTPEERNPYAPSADWKPGQDTFTSQAAGIWAEGFAAGRAAATPDPPDMTNMCEGESPDHKPGITPAASPDERLREALRDANEYLAQIADYSPSEVADAIDSVRAQIKDALAATDSRGNPDGASVPDQTRRIVVYDARCGRGGLDVPVGCTVGEAALLAAEMFGVRVGPNDRPSFGLRGTGLHASDPLPDDEDYELFVIGGTV